MNGVDYSKQLARDREYFQNTLRKQNDATSKQLENNEQRHSEIETKQRENYIQDKAELESKYQSNLDNVRKKTAEGLDNKSQEYLKRLENERDQFIKQSQESREAYNKRMSDIQNSYGKSFESERKQHHAIQGTQKENYQSAIKDNQRKTEKNLEEFQTQFKSKGSSLKDQYQKDLSALSENQEKRVNDLYNDEADKRFELKDRLGKDIDKMREVSQADKAHMEKHSKEKIKTAQENFDQYANNLNKDFTEKNEQTNSVHKKNSKMAKLQSQQELMDAKRDYNKRLKELEIQNRKLSSGGSEKLNEFSKKQQGITDQMRLEDRNKKLTNLVKETKQHSAERYNQDHEKFVDSLKDQNASSSTHLEKTVSELHADRLISGQKERERAQLKIDQKESQFLNEKRLQDNSIAEERKMANDKMRNIKDQFNKAMKDIDEKNTSNVETMKKQNIEDKNEFIKQVTEQRNKEVYSLKTEFAKTMDETVLNYEQRIDNLQKGNETLKETMNNKIAAVRAEADREVASQRNIYETRKEADYKAQELFINQKNNEHRAQINNLNSTFKKKMDVLLAEQTRKNKMMSNDYEHRLKELEMSRSRDLANKDAVQAQELERIKATFNDEKARIVNQYENQIHQMREGQKVQLESMKKYKELS